MADILHELTIDAPAEKIYTALTQADEVQSWWSKDAAANGDKLDVRFYNGMVHFGFEVEQKEPNSQLNWAVKQGPPEWGDTRVTWQLKNAEQGGTSVRFGHHDWKATDGMYASVNFNWAFFLTSLKQYVETGNGMPAEG